jgi:membrane protease YdiL (CAAX protease family)
MEQNRIRTIRNLSIFAAVTIGVGWLGAVLNRLLNMKDPNNNLGLLLWLIAPLTTSLLLRAFGGDGWKDIGLWPKFRGNCRAYWFSLLAYPFMIGSVLAAGLLAGSTSLLRLDGSALLTLTAVSFGSNFFKNIFEEFSWRGYLTPRLQALGISRLANHLITGVVWGAWHLPYWFVLWGKTGMQSVTTISLIPFVLLSLLALLPTAVIFGELRMQTNSIWPVMLIHTVANAVTLVILSEGFVSLNPGLEFFFIPAIGGLLCTILSCILAYGIYKRGLNGK